MFKIKEQNLYIENFFAMSIKEQCYTKHKMIDKSCPLIDDEYYHDGLFYRQDINKFDWKCVLDTNFESCNSALYVTTNKKFPIFYGVISSKRFYSKSVDKWLDRDYYRMYVGLWNENKELEFKQINYNELFLYTKSKKILNYFRDRLHIWTNPIYVPNNIEIISDWQEVVLK